MGQNQFSEIYNLGDVEIAKDVGYYNGKYYMGFFSNIPPKKNCGEYSIIQVPEDDLKNSSHQQYYLDSACLVITIGRQGMSIDSKGNVYVAGQRSIATNLTTGVLVRIKSNGEMDWYRDFETGEFALVYNSILVNDNKILLVQSGRGKDVWEGGINETLFWVDSLGNTTKEVKTEQQDWFINFYQQIHPMGDTAYIIASQVYKLFNFTNSKAYMGLRCIDTAGVELWRRTDFYGGDDMTGVAAPVRGNRILGANYLDTTLAFVGIDKDKYPLMVGVYDATTGAKLSERYDSSFNTHRCSRGAAYMIPLKNGDALMIGQRFTSKDPKVTRGLAGWIARLNPDGNIIWQRIIVDTLNSSYQGNNFRDGMELADGDLLLSGECSNKKPKTYDDAWLLRLDSMGCFTPGCKDELIMLGNQTVSTTEPKQREVFFSVQKNPVQEELIVNFYQKLHRSRTELILMDMSGKVVEHYQVTDGTSQASFRTGHLASGNYVLTLRTPELNLQTQLIVKQ